MFSRFTLGCLITKKRKKTETVIDHIMQTWVGVGVGSSKKFLADIGGEFANPNFSTICENLNVHFLNAAAKSTW